MNHIKIILNKINLNTLSISLLMIGLYYDITVVSIAVWLIFLWLLFCICWMHAVISWFDNDKITITNSLINDFNLIEKQPFSIKLWNLFWFCMWVTVLSITHRYNLLALYIIICLLVQYAFIKLKKFYNPL